MFEVRLQTAHANPDVCANDKVLEVECVVSRKTKKDFTGQPFDSMAALFRLAFTEDYYVDAWVVGCNGNGYAKVQAVQVQKSAP